MLLGPEGVAVFDFDAICATHPAMDLARFAAVIVRRDPSRLDAAYAALARLLDAYGDPPPDLDWYLAAQILCQVGSPFRKGWPDWPEKVEGIIAAAESVLDRPPGLGGASVRGARSPRSIERATATRSNGSGGDGLVMITSGFPRRSETFALNELLALERAGSLAAVFATKAGDGAEPHPGSYRCSSGCRCLRRARRPSRPTRCSSASKGAGSAASTPISRTSRRRSRSRSRAGSGCRTGSASTRATRARWRPSGWPGGSPARRA